MPLEIASFNPASALIACKSGADRIELCANAEVGGTTPSLSDFKSLKISSEIKIPIMVMIRPRGGDFVYSSEEFSSMESEIGEFMTLGVEGPDGFVFGNLTTEGSVDVERCRRLLDLVGGRPCTFHRAFDVITPENREKAVEDIVALGFTGILTSGGASNALDGKDVLASLVAMVDGRGCEIIVGGGVRAGNLEVLRGTGARWFHSSADLGGGEADEGEVRGMLKGLEGKR